MGLTPERDVKEFWARTLSVDAEDDADQEAKTAVHNHGTMLVGSVAGNTFFIGGVDPAEFEKLICGRLKT